MMLWRWNCLHTRLKEVNNKDKPRAQVRNYRGKPACLPGREGRTQRFTGLRADPGGWAVLMQSLPGRY